MGSGRNAQAPSAMRVRVLRAMWIVYWVILTGLLLSPKLPKPPVPMDRRALIAHIATFILLGFACGLVRWAAGQARTGRWLMIWLTIFAAYGGAAELLQPLVGRHASWLDWLADAVGALVGLLTAAWLSRRRTDAPPTLSSGAI